MGLTLVTAPTSEPVNTDDAKLYCRINSDTEIDLISDLITGAREDLDGARGWLGRALMTQTWDLTLDGFPGERRSPTWPAFARKPGDLSIEVPLPPLQSVTSITYLDRDRATQTLSTDVYRVLADKTPGEIVLKQDQVWPLTAEEPSSVTVRFVAGFTGNLPQQFRQLILSIVAWRFENREGGDLPQSIMDKVAGLKLNLVH